MWGTRRVKLCSVLALALTASAVEAPAVCAAPAPAPVGPIATRAAAGEHKVIAVDNRLAYIDIGRADGAYAGEALEVIEQAVPAGGAPETFHLGYLVLDSVGESVSLARVPDDLQSYVRMGTLLRVPRAAPAPAPALQPAYSPPARPTPAPPKPPASAPPIHPVVLRTTPEDFGFQHQAPAGVAPGLSLTLSCYAPAPLENPVIMFRRGGSHDYQALPFQPRADQYYTVTIPGEDVIAPSLEYYIVVDTPRARRALAFGDPERPAVVDVEQQFVPSLELKRYGFRNEVSGLAEYVLYPRDN